MNSFLVECTENESKKRGDKTLARKDVKLMRFVIAVLSAALSAAGFVFALHPTDPLSPALVATAKNSTQPRTETTLEKYKTTSLTGAKSKLKEKRYSVSKSKKRRSLRPVLIKKIQSKTVAGNSPNYVLVYNSSRRKQGVP